jgi:hypothetical protein
MKQRRISWLVAAAFVLATGGPLAAQTGTQLLPEPGESNTRVGSRGANFLSIGVGARAMAMGNAYGALAEGADAIYWNVAGMAQDPRFTALVSYNDMYGDFGLQHIYGAVTVPAGEGAWGFSIISFQSGDITYTTEQYPEGGDPQFGETFEWTDLSVGLSYARQITDRLNVGMTVKYARSGINDANASFFGGDAGIQFRTGLLGTTIAAAINNLGSAGQYSGPLLRTTVQAADELFDTDRLVATTFDTRSWDMPTSFTFSVLWDLVGSPEALLTPNADHALVLMTDATDAIDTAVMGRAGLEYSFREMFYVRGGKFFMNEANAGFRDFGHGLTGGLGVAIPLGGARLHVDYAYQGWGELENIQVFSVGFDAGR